MPLCCFGSYPCETETLNSLGWGEGTRRVVRRFVCKFSGAHGDWLCRTVTDDREMNGAFFCLLSAPKVVLWDSFRHSNGKLNMLMCGSKYFVFPHLK